MIVRLSLALAVVLGPAGCSCSDDVPTFPPVSRDAGIECRAGGGSSEMDGSVGETDEIPCPAGQVCLQNRCFTPCSTDSDCSLAEECSSGQCVRRGGPRPDGGPGFDAGFERCDAVMCDMGTVCHPATGDCVMCLDDPSMECGGATTICDRAFGRCRPFNPRPCGPCNNNFDCMDMMMVSQGECVDNDPHFERVCLLACDPTMDAGAPLCPAGLACQDGRCRPPVAEAVSCTSWLAARDSRGCFGDGDCVGLGGTAAAGQCAGAMGTPDGGMAGRCLQPCRAAEDCVAPLMCDGNFCVM